VSALLATLDEVDFASLEDAYGPAVDVPARLRRIAFSEPDDGRGALFDLGAGIFHQGGYYPSAASCVPFLIEIAGAPTPIRDEVLLFLADMSGAPPDTSEPFDPFVFRSAPGAPDYPEATKTIDAIARGRGIYVAALDAPEPRVRIAAAFLLSRIAKESGALRAALARETDALTAVGLRLALARGGEPLPETDELLARAVTRVLVTSSLEHPDVHAAFALLLDQPLRERGEMPFFDGDLSALALARLRPMLTDERARELLERALETRLGRGERFVEAPMPPSIRVADDEATPRVVSFAEYGTDRPLRGLVASLAEAAFGTTPRAGLLTRDELDASQRAVLALTVTYGVPVPVSGAPWITADAMSRFLTGGGPLDRALEIEGVRAPIFVHLHGPTHEELDARLTQVLEAIVAQSSDDELFDLVIDLFADGYDLAQGGYLPTGLARATSSLVFPRLGSMRVRFERYAASLADGLPSGPAARFALTPWIDANEPSPPHLDRVAGSAVAFLRAEGVPWLKTFPEPRRSQMIARFGNPYLLQLFEGVCERLPEALLDAFVAPECAWFEHDAEGALGRVPSEMLERARPSLVGRRAAIVRRVLRARTGEGRFVLTLRAEDGGLRATLLDWTGTTRLDERWDAQPRVEELADLAATTKDVIDAHVTIAGELDGTVEYRVMRLVGEAGFRGAITNGRGSTMTIGRNDA
jgi:hypothetical protein